jgi:hypothetical protein
MAERFALARRKPGTHLPPELKNRAIGIAAVEYPPGSGFCEQPDLVLLTRIAEGLRDLNNGSLRCHSTNCLDGSGWSGKTVT